MAQSCGGRPQEHDLARESAGPWCTWLRCAQCGTTTVHALIVDALADCWRRDGCDRERYDRLPIASGRRIRRHLDALAAEGVTIVRALSAEHMSLDISLVEVIEYADGPKVPRPRLYDSRPAPSPASCRARLGLARLARSARIVDRRFHGDLERAAITDL